MLKRIAWLQTSGILRGYLFGEIFWIDRGELSESSSCTRRCDVTNEWNPPKFLTSVPTQNVDFAELTDTERILNVLLRKKKKEQKENGVKTSLEISKPSKPITHSLLLCFIFYSGRIELKYGWRISSLRAPSCIWFLAFVRLRKATIQPSSAI